MAPLAGLRFTQKAKGVTMHVVNGATGVKEREESVFSSPRLSTPTRRPFTTHTGTSLIPPPPNTSSSSRLLPTTKSISEPPAPVQTQIITVFLTLEASVAPSTTTVFHTVKTPVTLPPTTVFRTVKVLVASPTTTVFRTVKVPAALPTTTVSRPVNAPVAPTQTTTVSRPVNAPVAPTQTTTVSRPVSAPPVPTLTPTNTAVGDQESDPGLTVPLARIQSGNVVGNQGKETTTEIPTTFVTSGVFTTSLTTVLPDGQTTVVVATTTGIHTVATTTAVPTQIGTISSKSGPPAGIIGGIVGAIAILILALILFCIVKRKRRNLNRRRQAASNAGPPIPTIGPISVTSTIPRPFLDISSPHEQPAGKRAKDQLESPNPEPRRNRENGQDNIDPFRDPENVLRQDELVVGARNALDRLQELTREAEEELRELGNRARRGELSDSEQERLDEIRHTTGLTIVYDPGLGRFSTTSSASSYTTSPPSYHSDRG